MKKGLSALALVAFWLGCFSPLWAFDEQLAKNYEKFFAGYSGKNLNVALGMLEPYDTTIRGDQKGKEHARQSDNISYHFTVAYLM